MAGKKYRTRGRTVKKMTRDGLTEENLKEGSVVNVSRRDKNGTGMRSVEHRIGYRENPMELERTDISGKAGKAAGRNASAEILEEDPERMPTSGKRNRIRKYRFSDKNRPEGEPPARAAPALSETQTKDPNSNRLAEMLKRRGKQTWKPTDRIVPDKVMQKDAVQHGVAEKTEEDSGESLEELDTVSAHSARMGSVRERGAGASCVRGAAETAHKRKKKMVQDYARKEKKAAEETTLSDFKEEVEKKSKRERLAQEQRKSGRLLFDDEGGGMVRGRGMNPVNRAASAAGTVAYAAGTAAGAVVHGKLHEEAQENAAVEGVYESGTVAEQAAISLKNAQDRRRAKAAYVDRLHETDALKEPEGRLKFGLSDLENDRGTGLGADAVDAAKNKKASIRHSWQKQRYQKAYAAAKQGKKTETEALKTTETIAVKAKRMVQEAARKNRGTLAFIGVMALLFLMISVSLGSCAAVAQGSGTSVISTTYAADDSDIYAAENYYRQMEQALNAQINNMAGTHPDYGDYQYQIDEISHNPYQLISYLTVKYGDFTFEQVKDELEEIFREQYSITTESERTTLTQTKTVRVGESLGQVVTSGYCNCSICCGQWSGGPTASGAMPTASHTIAVDASDPFVPMGTKVIMNGVEYTVEDTGNFARYGVQFDVYYGDHASASAHGHQTWEAYIADDNGSQEVEVTTTETVNRLNTTLTNHDLDSVLKSRMNGEEEERYGYYNLTYGNRDYLFDLDTLPAGDGFGYQIPSEALSDEKFARMITEAEKYLGMAYVWGGYSPTTGFDCSGFVSYVINNCGNGWNVGRQTAEGLRSCCAYVSPSEAQPGDLIFFQGTYDTAGASHVGIYVGNNMMIHCGNPIKYSNIATSYWQEHFLAFGRLS